MAGSSSGIGQNGIIIDKKCANILYDALSGTRPPTDNSDAEDEPSGPPKKKRRRQALSCTGVYNYCLHDV